MKSICKYLVLALVLIIFPATAGYAADITSMGNWTVGIGVMDLQGGAGTNLQGTYSSASSQVELTISGTMGQPWSIDVQRVDTSWHENLVLMTRRTDLASNYQAVDTVSRTLFTGNADKIVPLQFQVSGVSVTIPPGTYSTTIYYTITSP